MLPTIVKLAEENIKLIQVLPYSYFLHTHFFFQSKTLVINISELLLNGLYFSFNVFTLDYLPILIHVY